MKIEFQIGPHIYEVRKPTIRDYYKIRQELAFNETPGFYLINLLSGCPESELRRLDIDQYESLWDEFQEFYSKENTETATVIPVIELHGMEFGLIKLESMTVGEFADLDIIFNSENSENRLHEILAILYREIASRKDDNYELAPYSLEAQKVRAEIFKDLSVSYARGILGFFLLSAIRSIESTADSLRKNPPTKESKLVQESLEILKELLGPGSILSSFLPEEVLLKSTEPQISQSTQPSTFSQLNQTKQSKRNWSVKNLLKNIGLN